MTDQDAAKRAAKAATEEWACGCCPECEQKMCEHSVGFLATVIDAAVAEAVKERDFQWWEAIACVDNVPPTPEGCKWWVINTQEHWVREARREERERIARWALERRRATWDEISDAYNKALTELAAALHAVVEGE